MTHLGSEERVQLTFFTSTRYLPTTGVSCTAGELCALV